MWRAVLMSQDGAGPGDFMLQNANCAGVKLGQEFPRVAFRGHIRSLPKLVEITSHASKCLCSCCWCSLADRIYCTNVFSCSVVSVLCCSLVCFIEVHLWLLLRKWSFAGGFTPEMETQYEKRESERNALISNMSIKKRLHWTCSCGEGVFWLLFN